MSVALQIELIMQKYKYLRDLKPMNQRGQSRQRANVLLTTLGIEQLGHQLLCGPSLNVSRSTKNVLNVEVGGEKLYKIAQLVL